MISREWSIDGWCADGFKAVAEAFAENYRLGLEIGSCAAVTLDSRLVVDVWGGHTDESRDLPWGHGTIVNLMSVAKGVAALVVHMLVDRGAVDLDAPLARYWPEFGQAGKDGVLVRHVLDHRAGIPVLSDPLRPGAVYDWEAMTAAIERQPQLYQPGAQPAYHTIIMSFLVGELVRRVAGKTFGAFLRDEVTGPLGVDYHVGLPFSEHGRCARFYPWMGYNTTDEADGSPPTALLLQAWAQFDPATDDGYNSSRFRTAELPGVNGHGNARAVARLYSVLANGGELRGVRLLSSRALDRAIECQWEAIEPVLEHDYRMALGFTLNSPDAYMGPNPRAFGHVGAGGSIGMCDPDANIAVAYGMNKMHPHRDNGPRARRILDAVYSCL